MRPGDTPADIYVLPLHRPARARLGRALPSTLRAEIFSWEARSLQPGNFNPASAPRATATQRHRSGLHRSGLQEYGPRRGLSSTAVGRRQCCAH